MFAPRSYALASGLRGFPSSSLRVRIVEVLSDGQHVNVLTADLLSVGVPLTIDVSRLSPIDGEGEAAVEAETSAHDDWLLHHTAEDCGATWFTPCPRSSASASTGRGPKTVSTSRIVASIQRDYPHRIDADGSGKFGCPVCCGDGVTDDRRYAASSTPVRRGGYDQDLYPCGACEPWALHEHGERREGDRRSELRRYPAGEGRTRRAADRALDREEASRTQGSP